MDALGRLADFADSHTDVGRRYGFGLLLGQFRRSLAGELDYQREAANLTRLRELTAAPHLLVPEPVPDYTSSRVLTMSFVPGRKVTDVGPLGLLEVDGEPLVRTSSRPTYTSSSTGSSTPTRTGQHPAHPGRRLALIDLGMVATVRPGCRTASSSLLAISDADGEEAATVLASMGPARRYDADRFHEDVAALVTRRSPSRRRAGRRGAAGA